ncbi:MAG: hypothetical protein MHM6MM_006916 [Cercozoa sp. M6MM]
MSELVVQLFFHKPTWTATYVAWDPLSRKCALIDTAADFDVSTGKLSFEAAKEVQAYVAEHELDVEWILETHAHADHLTAAQYLKKQYPQAKVGIGAGITVVQETFKPVFGAADVVADGSQFDVLFKDGDEFKIGFIECRAMSTPGHTPACTTYVCGSAAFTGDTFFHPDVGSARCDFPRGSATQLYESLQKILSLPDHFRIYVGHDYPGDRREVETEITVARMKAENKHVVSPDGHVYTREEYIEMREKRDSQLNAPRLLLPSIQVNMRAGSLPPADHGAVCLRLPVKVEE